jgi:hypothetical protein
VKDATFFDDSLSGFGSGLVTSSFVLFLLASLWALLPAVYDLAVGFARGFVTAGLVALGLVLTLLAWIKSLGGGFFVFALLGFVVAVAITLFALLALLPELRRRPALPGALAGAAQWANQPAPDLSTAFGGRAQAGAPGQQGQPGPAQPPTQPYGTPPSYAPPAPTGAPAPGAATPPPPPPYGPEGPDAAPAPGSDTHTRGDAGEGAGAQGADAPRPDGTV